MSHQAERMDATHWGFPQTQSDSSRRQLFCFPFAGGGASVFTGWQSGLPADLDVYAIRLPARDYRLREAPYTSMAGLVRDLREIFLAQSPRPFAFFGHSMGALIAFELARELASHHRPPFHLFLSAREAPHLPSRRRPIHELSDDEFLAELQRQFRQIPEAIINDKEMLRYALKMLRGDFTLLEGYAYQASPPLTCPITVFGGAQDRIPKEDLDAWSSQTSGKFEVITLDGGHFFLQSHKSQLLEELASRLRVKGPTEC